jgi:hypothetical protein
MVQSTVCLQSSIQRVVLAENQTRGISISQGHLAAVGEARFSKGRIDGRLSLERLQNLSDVQILVHQLLLRPLMGTLCFIEKLAHL